MSRNVKYMAKKSNIDFYIYIYIYIYIKDHWRGRFEPKCFTLKKIVACENKNKGQHNLVYFFFFFGCH